MSSARAHARLSPSSADRWMQCPGSVRLIDGLPDSSTIFAAEGTVAHSVRADCLELGIDPGDMPTHQRSADGFTFDVDDDMARFLQPGIDWLRQQPGRMFVETRVDMRRWIPDGFGTLDVGIVGPKLIIIDDLKYGRVPVYPKNNRQLRIYALGFWEQIARHHTDATDFLLSIDQPRAAGGGTWHVTLDDLLAFGAEVEAAAALTADPAAPLHAGEKQCRYCPLITDKTEDTPPPDAREDGDEDDDTSGLRGRPGCPEHDRFILDLIQLAPSDLEAETVEMKAGSLLTPIQKGRVAQHRNMIRTWVDRVRDDLVTDALAGRPTPGVKLVDGPAGRRTWSEPDKVEALLRPVLKDGAVKVEVITPAKAEKALTPTKTNEGNPKVWAAVQPFLKRPPAKPAVVSEDDPRDPFTVAENHFDDC